VGFLPVRVTSIIRNLVQKNRPPNMNGISSIARVAIRGPWLALGTGLLVFSGIATLWAKPKGEDDAPPRVIIATTLGPITLELYPDRAPLTVANFLRYVDSGSLDGGAFYRTVRLDNQKPNEVPIQVVQGGRFGAALAKDDGDGDAPVEFPPIAHEPTSQTGLRHEPGAISMARAAPGTATSEFFISVVDSPALDFGGKRNPDGQGFAVFGRVLDGMDVVRRIHGAATDASRNRDDLGVMQGQLLDAPVRICSVSRWSAASAKHPHAPKPHCETGD